MKHLPPGFEFATQDANPVRPRPDGPCHYEPIRWYIHKDERVAVMLGGQRPRRLVVERYGEPGYAWASSASIDAFMRLLPGEQAAVVAGTRDMESGWST